MEMTLQKIREKERDSHIEMYTANGLYQDGSWLKKPVKTVLDLFPHFSGYEKLKVLDLGCGVGRNSIAIAQNFRSIPCEIDCVDILDLAIKKLAQYAETYGVASSIHGIALPIEDFPIPSDTYDLILAISALEHIDSEASFISKLKEIRDGIQNNGIVCLVINSDVREYEKATGTAVQAQFEVNFPSEDLLHLLENAFSGWEVLKSSVSAQQYDIPREWGICQLNANVVTFVAKNSGVG